MWAPDWGQSQSQLMLKRDHAGRIREVPQEEDSPSMYIAQVQ
jgi:hypothetical protein